MKNNMYVQRMFIKVLLTFSIFSISCSSPHREEKNPFCTYRAFCDSLRNLEDLSVKDMGIVVKRFWYLENDFWAHTMADTLVSDSMMLQNLAQYAFYRAAFSGQLARLTDNRLRSYRDVVDLQHTVVCKGASLPQEVAMFFDSMDSCKVKELDVKEIMEYCSSCLAVWERAEMHVDDDVFQFLREEDYLFRLFLTHLYDYPVAFLHEVISKTDLIMGKMCRSAEDGRIDTGLFRLYMGIRINRRMLQNALRCIDAIERDEIRSAEQEIMTMAMLVSPFMNWQNGCCTHQQMNELYRLAGKMEKLMPVFQGRYKQNIFSLDSLPNMIIKRYLGISNFNVGNAHDHFILNEYNYGIK